MISISTEESTALITLAASISNNGSALEILITNVLTACEERKKGQKTFKNLSDFIKHVLFNETNLAILEQRLRARSTEPEVGLQMRLSLAQQEILSKHKKLSHIFNYSLLNESSLEQVIADLERLFKHEFRIK